MTISSDMSREWELEGKLHRTAGDAFRQLVPSKGGCLVAATDVYLLALKTELHKWIAEIDQELQERCQEESDNEFG